MSRIYLSPPDVGPDERRLLLDAFDSNWIAPLGPHVDAFEEEFADYVGVGHAAALSSGTAALHLALVLLGVGRGDEVFVPSLTFVATANAALYVGAKPVLVDSHPDTWTIDPRLLEEELVRRSKTGKLPAAVITVDLYGQCADYSKILDVCAEYEVPVVEDAAEALGATYRGKAAGSFGQMAAFSFNGNKIITTSGGGMLVSDSAELTRRSRYLSTQARQPVVHYEHQDVGFNYRMSNLLAAVGRGQLANLRSKVARRTEINAQYKDALADLPGISFMPVADYGTPNHWLTCITIDARQLGSDREQVRNALEGHDIESRPTWKPLHLQPVFKEIEMVGGQVAADVFNHGLCLPSGSSLTEADQQLVIAILRESAVAKT